MREAVSIYTTLFSTDPDRYRDAYEQAIQSLAQHLKGLRRRRDFARQRWPFGQFHLTRAGGFVGWAGCPATSSACGIRIW